MSNWNTPDSGEAIAPLYCAKHPSVETYLRCAKCETPICARCRVSTPVGFRCFECARLSVLPTYAVPGSTYVRAVFMGLAAATVSGVLMGIFPNFEFWAALLMGIAVPEAIAYASNQKRSPGLQIVAIGSIFAGFAISRFVMMLGDPLVFNPELFRALPFHFDQYTVLWLALAAFLAYRRLQ